MTVTSRHAVPSIPMQLARSFAERTDCPVMRYLADAQFLGLKGLWARLCAGKLPARCSKQWYFETFCGVDADTFAAQGLDALGADVDIVARLDGVVKPYDVLALMTVLPRARDLFPASARIVYGECEHLLLLEPSHAIAAESVINLLREVYCEVSLATAAAEAAAASERETLTSRSVAVGGSARHGGDDDSLSRPGAAGSVAAGKAARAPSRRPKAISACQSGLRTDLRDVLHGVAATDGARREADGAGGDSVGALLERALAHASARRTALVRVGLGCALALLLGVLVVLALGVGADPLRGSAGLLAVAVGALALIAMAIRPATRAVAAAGFAALVAGLALAFLAVRLARSWRGLLDAPGRWQLLPLRALDALPAASALPAVGAALSFALLALLLFWPLTLLGRALGALHVHARRAPLHRVSRERAPAAALVAAAFRRSLLAFAASLSAWLVAISALQLAALAGAEEAPSDAAAGRDLVALNACVLAASALLGACCGSAHVAREVGGALERAVGGALDACASSTRSRGMLTSLVPLIGFGTSGAPLPDIAALLADSARSFRTLRLDGPARALVLELSGGAAPHPTTTSLKKAAASGPWIARLWPRPASAPPACAAADAARVSVLCAALEAQQQRSSVLSASLSRRGSLSHAPPPPPRTMRRSLDWLLGLPPCASTAPPGALRRASLVQSAPRAQRAERADAFVVAVPSDEMAAELCAWAERFEARERRPPTLWVHDLCADMPLSPTQLLAHMPFYMARCERLLLLASPLTPLSLPALVACHCWRVLCAQPGAVDVVLAATVPREQTVAAFDAFHVMHATVDDAPAADAREQAAVAERLHACVELATVRAFNWGVRELLPIVSGKTAAELYRAMDRDEPPLFGPAHTAGAEPPSAGHDRVGPAVVVPRSSHG